MPDFYLYKTENKKLMGLGGSEILYVRPLQNVDVHQHRYQGWFTNKTVCKYNSHRTFSHLYNYKNIEWGDQNRILWAVCVDRKTVNKHIGNVSLNISWLNRSAEFACIFGEIHEWHKGYCTQALKWIIDHAFNALNLNRVWLGTATENMGMIKSAEKAGMVKEGVLNSEVWLYGQYADVVRYGIVNDGN
jgi:RimJ/RimL family protein N-acetyltransferase